MAKKVQRHLKAGDLVVPKRDTANVHLVLRTEWVCYKQYVAEHDYHIVEVLSSSEQTVEKWDERDFLLDDDIIIIELLP